MINTHKQMKRGEEIMKTDKTDIFFNEMYKEISKTELHYEISNVYNNLFKITS